MITSGKRCIWLLRGMVGTLWDEDILNLRHLKRDITITFGLKLPLEIEFISPNAITC